jgi:hypothetical protein
MPAAFLTGALRFLQQKTVAMFGGPEKIWWPADTGTKVCTVPVECAAAPQDGQSRELAGLLTLATDGQVFHCTLADFPFQPEPEMIFMFGPPIANPDAPPATIFDPAASQKFMVKTTKIYGEQITITAELHSGV